MTFFVKVFGGGEMVAFTMDSKDALTCFEEIASLFRASGADAPVIVRVYDLKTREQLSWGQVTS